VKFQHLLLAILLIGAPHLAAQDEVEPPVVIGSKVFTESRLLGEIMAQLIEAKTEIPVERRFGLSGTKICFDALKTGEIDLYPEYTGTGLVTMLHEEPITDPLVTFVRVRREFLVRFDLEWLGPFGFNNTYAMAMSDAKAEELGIESISDLAAHSDTLRYGVSHEFLNRTDGWPGLVETYGLEGAEVRGMEHGLAYAAIQSDEIDLVDAYSTDGKLLRYKLRVLEDDQQYFPMYHAAPLIRVETLKRYPELRPLLEQLALRLPDARMQRLNYEVEEEKRPFAGVAREFLQKEGLIEGAAKPKAQRAPSARKQGFLTLFRSRWSQTLELTWQHLQLTLLAVLIAIVVSVPLAILCTRVPVLSMPVLGCAGVIQTIPSLALLAFMIPIPGLGLGWRSAVVALFLYAVLPIVRNTYTGICEVDPDLVEAAKGMGLTNGQILRLVQLPIATRTIMAGIRTSTVISVGVATLAAFIGAGGLGEPILTGLQLNDSYLILCGALPAAALAVLVDLLLWILERVLVPNGLQLSK